MRRITPNKNFTSRGLSSCCRWNKTEELKVEQKVLLTKKKTPLKLTKEYKSNTVSTACHPEDHKTQYVELVPRNFHSFNNNFSNTAKTLFSTAIKTQTPTTTNTPREFTDQKLPPNPLEKLNKRLKNRGLIHQSVARRLSWGSPNTTITFSHLTSMKEDLNPEQLSILSTFAQAKDLKISEYEKLKQEIRKYKVEYNKLLKEQQELNAQRQSNKVTYEALLTDLYEKQQELKQASKLRKIELDELKSEIQLLLLSKVERISTQ